MSRDWQKDMELAKEADGWEFESTFDGEGNITNESTTVAEYIGVSYAGTIFNTFEALQYWLQQYAVEKERADIAELAYQGLAESAVTRGEYQSLLDKHSLLSKAYRVQRDYLNKLEAREQKLREAIKHYISEDMYRDDAEPFFEKLLASLYPKEETK